MSTATYLYPVSDIYTDQFTGTGSFWDDIDTSHGSYGDIDPVTDLDTATFASFSVGASPTFASSRFPLSCGYQNATIWIRASKKPTGNTKIKGQWKVNGSSGWRGPFSASHVLTSSYQWFTNGGRVSADEEGPISEMDNVVLGVYKGTGFFSPSYADTCYVSELHFGIEVTYDTLAPSAPTLMRIGGVLASGPTLEITTLAPSLALRYVDNTNATHGDYDETKWVRWVCGTRTTGGTIAGVDVYWDSGTISTIGSLNSFIVINYPAPASPLDEEKQYFFRCKVWDANENESPWSSITPSIQYGESPWWNDNWTRRRRIKFGTNHSQLPKGYTIDLPFNTGVFKTLATDGHINESIQHSAEDACVRRISGAGDRLYFCYRSQINSAAYVGVYNYDTNVIGTILALKSVNYHDTHEYPVISIDSEGWIIVAVGGHNTASSIFYSSATYYVHFQHLTGGPG